jgi:CheY-like chemotaxis protein
MFWINKLFYGVHIVKEKIFLIDDNKDLLFNLKILFELNNFEVFTAINGKDALRKIYEQKMIPSLIVCDIMMPEMNGYDFFKIISSDPNLNSIPFIFLTAKSSSEDVRFGKLLGIDDYLTKPFIEEDLLAIVNGKLLKRKKILEVNKSFIQEEIQTSSVDKKSFDHLYSYDEATIFLVLWDEMEGPKLIDFYSRNKEFTQSKLEKIGVQLFQSSVSIFGFQDEIGKESLLLSIKNINKKGFLLFDSYSDTEVRGGMRLFMIGLINNEISYYDSLIFEKKMVIVADEYKFSKTINLQDIYNQMIEKGNILDVN